jgi:dTDP-4-dehydrorhamnose reductase
VKRIYIAGCGGMLGHAFYTVLSSRYELMCTDIDVNEEWLSYLDFRDLNQYRESVIGFSPDVLIHLGAHTDLEFCERNPEAAYTTNTLSVENACYIANQLNIPIVYISTAGIFDGALPVYDDWSTPNPLCVYARSKYAGERFVENISARHLICRAGWMMGGGARKDKKFIYKLISQIQSGSKELHIVNDKLGTPTYTIDFARNTIHLLENELWGLYNMVCSDYTSRLEVSHELIRLLGLSNKISIREVPSTYWKGDYFAPRPDSEVLDPLKLRLRNLYIMRDWKTCLKEYVDEHFSDLVINYNAN